MNNFFQELKRRNVVRVAAAYAVISWLVLQIADTLADPLGLPEWTVSFIFLLIVVGFPIIVIFSWAFELTDQGLKKTELVDADTSLTVSTGQKLNMVIIGTLVIALSYFIWESRFANPSENELAMENPSVVPPAEETASDIITDKSIAVLPFADFSPDGDQAWFADGLSEEILNSLVRTADLSVASRTSSFAHRDSELEIPEIAAELGVAHVLEGSVRRSESRLRVTAQLIRASDGFHLWSENYDRSPDDAIAIQEDLAISISLALQTAMDPEALAAMQEIGTDSVSAFNAYLQGLSYEPSCGNFAAPLCIAAFERAVELDPTFAEAWFRLANIWHSQMLLTIMRTDLGMDQSDFMDRFQDDIGRALRHVSNDVDRLKYQASLAAVQLRLRDQYELLQEYLALRPNDFQTLADFIALESLFDPERALASLYRLMDLRGNDIDASVYVLTAAYRLGDFDTVRSIARRVLVEAPTQSEVLYQAQRALLWAGEIERAATIVRLFEQTSGIGSDVLLDPREFDGQRNMVALRQACAEGRVNDALTIYNDGFADYLIGDNLEWLGLMTLGRIEEATATLEPFNLPETVLQLFSWVGYPQFDPQPFPFLMEVLEREGVVLREVRPLPFACSNTDQTINSASL